jgi:hypothetical protein
MISSFLPLLATTYAYLLPIRGTGNVCPPELRNPGGGERHDPPHICKLSQWPCILAPDWEYQLGGK